MNIGLAVAVACVLALGILQWLEPETDGPERTASVMSAGGAATDTMSANVSSADGAGTAGAVGAARTFAVWNPTGAAGGVQSAAREQGDEPPGAGIGTDTGPNGTADGATGEAGAIPETVSTTADVTDAADASQAADAAGADDPAGRFAAADFGSTREENTWIANLMNANHTRSVLATTSTALFNDGSPLLDWPVEPYYMPLAHDFYLVASGAARISDFTHNNGRIRQRHYVYITGRGHYGFDITAAPDTAVRAAAAGTVTGVYESYDEPTNTSDYGRYVVVDHGDLIAGARTYTLYAHLIAARVSRGERVSRGDLLGMSGSSGGSRIPHLHFEVRLGENSHAANIDPLEALPARDLRDLAALPRTADGFPASSVELYRRMVASDWGYDVYVRAAAEREVSGLTVPAGARLLLNSRSDAGATASVNYAGADFSLPLSALEFTWYYTHER